MSALTSSSQCHPLRIVEPKPTHYRPQTSPIRNSRRQGNVQKVPRPRNAFIIFRCQSISKLHSNDSSDRNRPPTPEKTLSKRAGVAWRELSDDEKQVYRDMAEQERLEHQEKYPGYRYQPNRNKSSKPRSSGPPTRREQVESLLMRTATSHSANSSEYDDSACPSPASDRCSSPDSIIMPALGEDSTHSLSHRRSMSLPHLAVASPHDPYPFSRTYFIEPTSCLSSPGPGPHRTQRRTSSARDASYSPVCVTPPPDCPFDLQYDHTTIPFSTFAPHSSTLSLPELVTFSECLALEKHNSPEIHTPQSLPTTSVHDPGLHSHEYFSDPQVSVTSSGTLYHRRQRSNTAPSAVVSPLTAISSSIGNWDGEMTATAAATSRLPSFTIASCEDNHTMASSSSVPGFSPIVNGTIPYGDFFAQQNREPFGSASSLSLPETVDIDRTPRRADFPAGVQEQYTQHLPASPINFTPHSTYGLQSYNAALEDLNISASPYDLAVVTSSIPSLEDFEDFDLDEYFSMSGY